LIRSTHGHERDADDSRKAANFISCGQFTEEEKALGKAIEQLIKETTPFDAYFAEHQNTLEGLTSNILSSLGRCVGFVAVAHHRGFVKRLKTVLDGAWAPGSKSTPKAGSLF
jgi:hypothetical protein